MKILILALMILCVGCTKTVMKCDQMYGRKVERCFQVYGDDDLAKDKCVEQMKYTYCAEVKIRR